IQVRARGWMPGLSVPTKSSRPSFKTRRGSCWEKLARRSSRGTTRTSVWASRHPRRLLRAPTLTRNAPSLVMCPFEGGSSLAW
ncbi:RPS11 isoform 9, partial [Pan troglodytes]